jgi:hypothetical protein
MATGRCCYFITPGRTGIHPGRSELKETRKTFWAEDERHLSHLRPLGGYPHSFLLRGCSFLMSHGRWFANSANHHHHSIIIMSSQRGKKGTVFCLILVPPPPKQIVGCSHDSYYCFQRTSSNKVNEAFQLSSAFFKVGT